MGETTEREALPLPLSQQHPADRIKPTTLSFCFPVLEEEFNFRGYAALKLTKGQETLSSA